ASLKAIQEQIAATSRALTVLDSGLRKRMEDSMSKPLAGVGGKVDSLAQDFGFVRESITEVNTRLSKLDQKMTDLDNTIKTMQAPPPPPAAGGALAPSAAAPPPGVSSKSLYDNALRDKMGGNNDLARKGFTDYLAWFGTTDLAPNAQYYLGELDYNEKKFDAAVASFDQVLAFGKNAKTNDAHLMKGRALAELGQRSEAEKEFRALIADAPNSDAAGRARAELRKLGLSTSPRPPSSTKKH
ncbi:MAG: tetratricopeptide repeat protein, partial [Acidobacteria bacterium]|nr:tetratricopeptide repeat protein [Acidobacteriota bacterium]